MERNFGAVKSTTATRLKGLEYFHLMTSVMVQYLSFAFNVVTVSILVFFIKVAIN